MHDFWGFILTYYSQSRPIHAKIPPQKRLSCCYAADFLMYGAVPVSQALSETEFHLLTSKLDA